jgi:hypothetical protein
VDSRRSSNVYDNVDSLIRYQPENYQYGFVLGEIKTDRQIDR